LSSFGIFFIIRSFFWEHHHSKLILTWNFVWLSANQLSKFYWAGAIKKTVLLGCVFELSATNETAASDLSFSLLAGLWRFMRPNLNVRPGLLVCYPPVWCFFLKKVSDVMVKLLSSVFSS
jgi:hypothetical protein